MEELFFLTTMTVITGYLFTWFGPRLEGSPKPLDGYTVLKIFKRSLDGRLLVSLCEKDKKRFIVRSLVSQHRSLAYKQMKHEISVLKVLNGASIIALSGRTIRVPKLFDFLELGHQLTLVRENIEGVPLKNLPSGVQLSIFSDCLDFFEGLSNKIDKSIQNRISKRSNISVPIFFPLYFAIAVTKYPGKILCFIRAALHFFRNVISIPIFSTDYVFSHKDLHQGNILVDNDRVGIIDTEIALMSERGTDLAISFVSYWDLSGHKEILDFLKFKLPTINSRKKFLALSTFFMIQSIAMNSKSNHVDTLHAIEYLERFVFQIAKELVNELDTVSK